MVLVKINDNGFEVVALMIARLVRISVSSSREKLVTKDNKIGNNIFAPALRCWIFTKKSKDELVSVNQSVVLWADILAVPKRQFAI